MESFFQISDSLFNYLLKTEKNIQTRTCADHHKMIPPPLLHKPNLVMRSIFRFLANNSKTIVKESFPLVCRACQDESIEI